MTVSHSDEPTSPPTRPPDAEVGERPAVDVPPAHASAGHGSPLSGFAALVMAVLRLGIGWIFLWPFLDKTFGWGYSTPSENAWIDGGSPTQGFLSNVDVGPFADTFNDIAGETWADWLFMIGLLGIGVAVMLGIGLRIAAVSGTVMMALMWAAEWPLDKTTSAGDPSGTTNPLIDDHIIYALCLVLFAATYAGDHLGLGRIWARIPFVRRFHAVLR